MRASRSHSSVVLGSDCQEKQLLETELKYGFTRSHVRPKVGSAAPCARGAGKSGGTGGRQRLVDGRREKPPSPPPGDAGQHSPSRSLRHHSASLEGRRDALKHRHPSPRTTL